MLKCSYENVSIHQLQQIASGHWPSTVLKVINVLSLTLQVRISYAQRNFQTALSEKNVAGFHAALWQFVGIIVLAAPSFALANWLEVCVPRI